jgi:hypothetical protein
MAANDRSYALQHVGILVPDARITPDTRTSKTAGTLPSVYTQAGSRPGAPTSDRDTMGRLAATGSQAEDGDLEVYTQRGGSPGTEEAGFVWRDVAAGNTTSQRRGWDGPQIITGWETLYYSTVGVGYELMPEIVRLASGKLLCAYNVSILGVVQVKRFDPSDGTWTSADLGPDGAGTGFVTRGCTFVQLPSGRILAFITAQGAAQVDAYYTDDEGDTWAIAARSVLRTSLPAADVREIRARLGAAGDIVLLATYVTAGTWRMAQYASDDYGAHFRYITTSTAWGEPHSPAVEALDAGGFVLMHREASASRIELRTISSAWEDGSTLALTNMGASSGDVCMWRDEDGVYYAAFQGSTAPAATKMLRSRDGSTWTAWASPLMDEGGSDALARFAAASVGGRTAFVTRWSASTATYDSQSVAVLWLGGYSTHTAPAGASQTTDQDGDFAAWSRDKRSGGTDHTGACWIPIEEPADNGWNAFAVGTGTDTLSSTGIIVTTTAAGAQTRRYSKVDDTGDVGATAVFAEVALLVSAGGNDSTEEVALKLRLTDRVNGAGVGTYDYYVSVRFDGAGFSIYDEHAAAVLESVAVDCSIMIRVRVIVDSSGYMKTWYGRGGHVRTWTAGPDDSTLISLGVTANDPSCQWGHIAAPAIDTTSKWEFVGWCPWAARWNSSSSDSPAKTWTNPLSLHGRSLPTRPALITGGVRVHGTAGPAIIGDSWRIAARYDYPINAIHWEEDPSPRVRWRSTADNANLYTVWDTTSMASGGRLLNSTVGMMLAGANFRTAKLQGYDGAAWQDIGTLDLTVISSAPYTRDGDVIRVDAGTSFVGANYIDHSAYVGGWVELDGATRRKIVEHTAGAWTNQTTKRPSIRLDGILDTEPASGTCRVCAPSGVLVVHEHAADYRYLRLYIPAYVTADGYYHLGLCVVGHVEVLGFSPQWSRKVAYDAQTELQEWRDGSSRARTRGPVRRTVDLAWEDGVDESQVRAASAVPDYVAGSANGLPVATKLDTVSHVIGLLAASEGGVRPCVYLPRIDRSTGSISIVDPAAFVWGRLRDRLSRETILGLESRSAVDRLMALSIEEIP